MKVSYFHVAGEVPDTINGPDGPDAAVVIDVLRATTTIAWALHNGAEAIQTFADLDELRSEANAWPEQKCGQRRPWCSPGRPGAASARTGGG